MHAKFELTGNWDGMQRLLQKLPQVRPAIARGLGRAGDELKMDVRRAMRSQAPNGEHWAPLHPFTVQQKLSSFALSGGALEQAVTYRVLADLTLVVGLPGEKHPESDLTFAHLGYIHEYGLQIEVTEKMRAWLHSQGLHLNPETEHITIPGRPFLRPMLAGRYSGGVVRRHVVNELRSFLLASG